MTAGRPSPSSPCRAAFPGWRLLAVLTVVIAALAGCSDGGGDGSGGTGNRAWPLFESGEGRFRVALPEQPDRREVEADDLRLETRAVMFTSRLGDVATVNVTYADYPQAIADVDPQLVLTGAVTGAVERVSGTLAAQAALTAEGSPAVDYLIEDGDGWVQARVILVGSRLYLLQLAAPDRDPGAFERLVTSFELL